MKTRFLILSAVLLITGCASPTFEMPPAQIAALSDDQLCSYKNNYRDETKLNEEISRRNLNCDPYFRQCLNQGNKPGTQAMGFCMAVLRENERLQYERDRMYDDIGLYRTYPYGHHHFH